MSKADHFVDELLNRVADKGAPICVGIDPVIDRLPARIREGAASPVRAIGHWVGDLLKAVEPFTPAVKFQSACFERYGAAGLACLEACITQAKLRGLAVILDAKRGDIGISAAHYAAGCLSGADAVTINPYMGPDTMQPFIDQAAAHGQGLFALVRTSNPGSDALQTLALADGRRVVDAVADSGQGSRGRAGLQSARRGGGGDEGRRDRDIAKADGSAVVSRARLRSAGRVGRRREGLLQTRRHGRDHHGESLGDLCRRPGGGGAAVTRRHCCVAGLNHEDHDKHEEHERE